MIRRLAQVVGWCLVVALAAVPRVAAQCQGGAGAQTGLASVSCTGVAAWSGSSSYTAGAQVTFNGCLYRANQAISANPSWSPGTAGVYLYGNGSVCPAAGCNYGAQGPCGGGSPTATPRPAPPGATPTPTPTPTTPSGGGGGATNFTSAYWTQGDDPCTHNGPAGSGQPWVSNGSCSSCSPAWNASTAYVGGSRVSRSCSGGGNPTATPPPNATPTPTPRPTGTNPPPSGGMRFCPYIDVSPGAGSAIMQLANNGSGNKCYTLAFILGRGCSASWFGAFDLNSSEADALGQRIQELKNAGGNVIISFGGAAAPELANVCPDATSLRAQYQAVINKYHPMAIDLDIEDFDPNAIDRRNAALSSGIGVPIHYTLGVLQSGMTSSQISVLQNAKSRGVNVSMVNIMAMDYGGAVSDMYAAAISAANATKGQLSSVGYGGAQLGITPMIGQNDQPGEVFTISNAQSLRNNAAGAAMLAFWSVGRDNGGCPGSGGASPSCSGVSQSPFQFSKILQSY
jgi:hypothetical protein